MSKIPTVLHYSNGSGERLCGAKIHAWPEEWMDDKKARTLPRCPECETVIVEADGTILLNKPQSLKVNEVTGHSVSIDTVKVTEVSRPNAFISLSMFLERE